MEDSIRAFISPLLAQAKEQGIDLSQERATACRRAGSSAYGPMNWDLFGLLVTNRLEQAKLTNKGTELS